MIILCHLIVATLVTCVMKVTAVKFSFVAVFILCECLHLTSAVLGSFGKSLGNSLNAIEKAADLATKGPLATFVPPVVTGAIGTIKVYTIYTILTFRRQIIFVLNFFSGAAAFKEYQETGDISKAGDAARAKAGEMSVFVANFFIDQSVSLQCHLFTFSIVSTICQWWRLQKWQKALLETFITEKM